MEKNHKTLKIRCPCCDEEINLEIDKNNNVISVVHKENILKQATKEHLQNKSFEFGIYK